jgi:hypothetical protein
LDRGLRILFIVRSLNMDRVTEGLLRCALEAGHRVHVAIENRKDRAGRATGENVFDVLAAGYPQFSFAALDTRNELWLRVATRLRTAIDLLRYFEPGFREAVALRDRAKARAPWYVRLPASLGLFWIPAARRLADALLRAIERRLPLSERSLALLREFEPDILLVSPLVEIGSPQGDHLRAADSLGIPTGLVVASWDNLTTKGALRDVPDVTIVWNKDQIAEAVGLHGLPAGSVVAAGAHSHDHWFTWQPSSSQEDFAAKVGLDPDRRFLLYVCSSGFIAGDDEANFVREWSRRLWESGDPDLESLGVLVRPHPQNYGASWQDEGLESPGRLVVYPRGGVAPTDSRSKDEYFDSLHHASAVVGINTTALVDSAIARRPVFTIVGERFRGSQTGTLHFSYLARDEEGGVLSVAESWAQHFEQLGASLRSAGDQRTRIDDFLVAFVRPHGLDRPAAPFALDAIAAAAVAEKEPLSAGGLGRRLVGAWAVALGRWHELIDGLRPSTRRRRARIREKEQRRRERTAGAGSQEERVRIADRGQRSG